MDNIQEFFSGLSQFDTVLVVGTVAFAVVALSFIVLFITKKDSKAPKNNNKPKSQQRSLPKETKKQNNNKSNNAPSKAQKRQAKRVEQSTVTPTKPSTTTKQVTQTKKQKPQKPAPKVEPKSDPIDEDHGGFQPVVGKKNRKGGKPNPTTTPVSTPPKPVEIKPKESPVPVSQQSTEPVAPAKSKRQLKKERREKELQEQAKNKNTTKQEKKVVSESKKSTKVEESKETDKPSTVTKVTPAPKKKEVEDLSFKGGDIKDHLKKISTTLDRAHREREIALRKVQEKEKEDKQLDRNIQALASKLAALEKQVTKTNESEGNSQKSKKGNQKKDSSAKPTFVKQVDIDSTMKRVQELKQQKQAIQKKLKAGK